MGEETLTGLVAEVEKLRVELARTRTELAALGAAVGPADAEPTVAGSPRSTRRSRTGSAAPKPRCASAWPCTCRGCAQRCGSTAPGRERWTSGRAAANGCGCWPTPACPVEHLDIDALLALLAGAHRALRPGGLLVAETPNPTNLVMGACNFYLDPTHRVPIPPAQLEFLVRTVGFAPPEIWPLHPKEEFDLSGLTLSGVEPAASAAVADALARGLFGPQDYAVLAVRQPG